MGRKNRRNKREYRDRLGFNPNKYIQPEHHTYRTPYRGEVWFAELGYHPGTSVQNGCRPVLIVSNDKGNHSAATIVVLPLTSHLKRCSLPSHVMLRRGDLVLVNHDRPFEDSMILAEQITTISKSSLRNCIGRVTDTEKLNEIRDAVKIQLAI